MFDLKEVLLVDNILPPSENLEIIKWLSNTNWKIQHEGSTDPTEKVNFGFLNNASHVGFANEIYDADNPQFTDFNSMLFIYPRIITNIITHRCEINYKRVERFHWNYYYKDQQGVGHIDKEEDNYLSILYNPLTTDGGTQVNGKFYQDKNGQAKIFKSNWEHGGICCKKDKARASLNIVLQL